MEKKPSEVKKTRKKKEVNENSTVTSVKANKELLKQIERKDNFHNQTNLESERELIIKAKQRREFAKYYDGKNFLTDDELTPEEIDFLRDLGNAEETLITNYDNLKKKMIGLVSEELDKKLLQKNDSWSEVQTSICEIINVFDVDSLNLLGSYASKKIQSDLQSNCLRLGLDKNRIYNRNILKRIEAEFFAKNHRLPTPEELAQIAVFTNNTSKNLETKKKYIESLIFLPQDVSGEHTLVNSKNGSKTSGTETLSNDEFIDRCADSQDGTNRDLKYIRFFEKIAIILDEELSDESKEIKNKLFYNSDNSIINTEGKIKLLTGILDGSIFTTKKLSVEKAEAYKKFAFEFKTLIINDEDLRMEFKKIFNEED